MRYFLLLTVLVGIKLNALAQNRYDVSSVEEFEAAHDQASAGDSIVWESGTYFDTRMDISKDGLIVTAQPYGTVMFTGISRAVIDASNTTFSGFQYIGGNIRTLNVITINGSDVLITHVNIQDYTSYKYLIVDEVSRRTTISYSNFENRLNLDDQNILSILVDENEPGYHKIQYCSFKNFEGSGNDLGIEPIRIGVSTQAEFDSRTIVEYCYFTNCNGDGELISNKASQNVIRYNTFEGNSVAELVLRHGDEAVVYGNFFLDNMGGVRVREGSNHFIFNNYFEGLSRRAIYLQNESSDPLSDIHVYFNTIVNSAEMILGGSGGSNPPTGVTIANNIFTDPDGQLFEQATETETWIGNFSFGSLGIDRPSSGLVDVDPLITENAAGYYQPEAGSPVLEAAGDGYPEVPLFEGLQYDNEILLDLMQETRPTLISDRAVGASELSSGNPVEPHVGEMTTGPAYLFDNLIDYLTVNLDLLSFGNEEETKSIKISSNLDWVVTSSDDWITPDLTSGSEDSVLGITLNANEDEIARAGSVTIEGGSVTVVIEVNQAAGDPVILNVVESEIRIFPNPTSGNLLVSDLPSDTENVLVELFLLDGKNVFSEQYEVKDPELMIHLYGVSSAGIYLLKVKLLDQEGNMSKRLVQKLVIE